MIGNADDIVEQLIEAHRLGVNAVMLTFPEYLADLHRFAKDIQPKLLKAGCI
jgi:alkanesulfonate monooxygenase SsuD/methylene tetrahydromethanopterin reductase-like flavin-dependent oxidoreductase (luciferase family)